MLSTTYMPAVMRPWLVDGAPVPADLPAALRAVPAGARAAELAWLFNLETWTSGHFDRDADQAVETTHLRVKSWRAEPDPRARLAGSVHLGQVDDVALGVLAEWPAHADLAHITALSVHARELTSYVLAHLFARVPLRDLAVWRTSAWGPALHATLEALAMHGGGLLGLDLQAASWTDDAARILAGAPWFPRLEDLHLAGSHLGDARAATLGHAAGDLLHVDLSRVGMGLRGLQALVPRLRRARRLVLSGNPVGNAGVRALVNGGALAHVEDLWLADADLDDAAVEALVSADPGALRFLWLHGNRLTDAAVEVLARSNLLRRLQGLSLFGGGVTGPGALAGHALEDAWQGTTRLPGVGAWWFAGRPG